MNQIIVGYVRLSRDEDKENYASIENQKAMIQRYADEHNMTINKFYEDDGISGYKFNRPSFCAMLDKLDNGEIDIIIAKDLSRIGRNNAKVLLLLDRITESGKRIILIDDNYDTYKSDDDIIGIKTWYNERYIKDISKKIRGVIKMKQEEGTYRTHAPFGYKIENEKFVINEEQAEIIRKIFSLYTNGYGYRTISNILTDNGIKTPSMFIQESRIKDGKKSKAKPSIRWSDGSVKDILNNDFYIGVYRLHKRERKTVHGADKKVPKDNQYIFTNHHDPIISNEIFYNAQNTMQSRFRNNFEKTVRLSKPVPAFNRVMFCKECGTKLTLIKRKRKDSSIREYYICSRYNTKGIKYCSKSHLICREDIEEYFINFLNSCMPIWEHVIKDFNINDYCNVKTNIKKQIEEIEKRKFALSEKLKAIIKLKLEDMMTSDNYVISETYEQMQSEIVSQIEKCKAEISVLSEKLNDTTQNRTEDVATGIDIIKKITDNITIQDVESIVDKIIVDENGIPEIILKYNLNDYIDYNIEDMLNESENKKIMSVLQIISEEDRDYTSAKYISAKMNELGYSINKKSIIPYIKLAISLGILKEMEDKLKPYKIIVEKSGISEYIKMLH